MKKMFFGLLVMSICSAAKSQLANHKWQSTIQLESPTNVTLDFKKDTVHAIYTDSGELLEDMLYTVKKGQLTFQKVSGRSGCGTDIVGKYKFELNKESISLSVTEDICGDRAAVLDKSVWKKTGK